MGSFVVIDSPGHTAGHVSFWESDRILVLGDVIANLNIYSGLTMLREPEHFFHSTPSRIGGRHGDSSSWNRNWFVAVMGRRCEIHSDSWTT